MLSHLIFAEKVRMDSRAEMWEALADSSGSLAAYATGGLNKPPATRQETIEIEMREDCMTLSLSTIEMLPNLCSMS